VLWAVFAWYGTGRALSEPETLGERLLATAAIWWTSDGGLTWRRANLSARTVPGLSAVACNASGKCFADEELDSWAKNESLTYASSDGGERWALVRAAPQGSLSCALVKCTVVSVGFSKPASWVSDGAGHWVSSGLGKVASVNVSLFGLSCAENGTCVALGTDADGKEGVIYYSHDAGVTWASARIGQAPVLHRR